MNNILRPYLNEIGKALGNLGYEFCQQANAPEPLNIHSQVKQTLDNLCYNLHNLSSDLDAYRFNLIKNGEEKVIGRDIQDIETVKVAMKHLLHSSIDTHNGEQTNIMSELNKVNFLITSIYRLMAHGAVGSEEYIFDKIIENE